MADPTPIDDRDSLEEMAAKSRVLAESGGALGHAGRGLLDLIGLGSLVRPAPPPPSLGSDEQLQAALRAPVAAMLPGRTIPGHEYTPQATPSAGALAGLMGAAAGPQKMTLRNSQTTRQTTSPLYRPEDVEQAQRAQVEHLKGAYGGMQERTAAAAEAVGTFREQLGEAKAQAAELRGKEPELAAVYDRAGKEYDQALATFKRAKVDPDRFWSRMSATQAVMNAVGMAAGGFLEGFTGGRVKNAAAAFLQRAIDRDIAAQQAEMQRALAGVNLGAKAKAQAYRMLRDNEGNMRQASLQIVRATSAIKAARSDDALARENYARLGAAAEQQLISMKAQARARTTTSTTSSRRDVIVKPTAAGGKVDAPTVRKLKGDLAQYDAGREVVETLKRDIAKARSRYAQLGAGWVSDAAGQGLATDIKNGVKKLALINRKVLGDSGPITDKDIGTFDFISSPKGITSTPTMLRRLRRFGASLRSARARAVRYAFSTPQQLMQEGASAAAANTARTRRLKRLSGSESAD